jgi:hypothetical protein
VARFDVDTRPPGAQSHADHITDIATRHYIDTRLDTIKPYINHVTVTPTKTSIHQSSYIKVIATWSNIDTAPPIGGPYPDQVMALTTRANVDRKLFVAQPHPDHLTAITTRDAILGRPHITKNSHLPSNKDHPTYNINRLPESECFGDFTH